MKAAMVDGLLTAAAGTYVCLIAFGALSPTRDKVKAEAWRRKWGGFMKLAGPFIVIWGVYTIVRSR